MDPLFLFFRFGSVKKRKVKQFDGSTIRFFAVSALLVAFCFECEFVSIQLVSNLQPCFSFLAKSAPHIQATVFKSPFPFFVPR